VASPGRAEEPTKVDYQLQRQQQKLEQQLASSSNGDRNRKLNSNTDER
jgi:hypothetical protein